MTDKRKKVRKLKKNATKEPSHYGSLIQHIKISIAQDVII